MSSEAGNWHNVTKKLRRALGLCPPTPAEADKAMRDAGEVPLGADEIDRIVRAVTSGKVPPAAFHPDPSWIEGVEQGNMAEDSNLVLNRNPGEEDEEVDKQVEKLRQEALEDDDENDEQA